MANDGLISRLICKIHILPPYVHSLVSAEKEGVPQFCPLPVSLDQRGDRVCCDNSNALVEIFSFQFSALFKYLLFLPHLTATGAEG